MGREGQDFTSRMLPQFVPRLAPYAPRPLFRDPPPRPLFRFLAPFRTAPVIPLAAVSAATSTEELRTRAARRKRSDRGDVENVGMLSVDGWLKDGTSKAQAPPRLRGASTHGGMCAKCPLCETEFPRQVRSQNLTLRTMEAASRAPAPCKGESASVMSPLRRQGAFRLRVWEARGWMVVSTLDKLTCVVVPEPTASGWFNPANG